MPRWPTTAKRQAQDAIRAWWEHMRATGWMPDGARWEVPVTPCYELSDFLSDAFDPAKDVLRKASVRVYYGVAEGQTVPGYNTLRMIDELEEAIETQRKLYEMNR